MSNLQPTSTPWSFSEYLRHDVALWRPASPALKHAYVAYISRGALTCTTNGASQGLGLRLIHDMTTVNHVIAKRSNREATAWEKESAHTHDHEQPMQPASHLLSYAYSLISISCCCAVTHKAPYPCKPSRFRRANIDDRGSSYFAVDFDQHLPLCTGPHAGAGNRQGICDRNHFLVVLPADHLPGGLRGQNE